MWSWDFWWSKAIEPVLKKLGWVRVLSKEELEERKNKRETERETEREKKREEEWEERKREKDTEYRERKSSQRAKDDQVVKIIWVCIIIAFAIWMFATCEPGDYGDYDQWGGVR